MSVATAPRKYNISCRQYERFFVTFTITDTSTGDPVDLTGATVVCEARFGSNTARSLNFNPQVSGSPTLGKILIDVNPGDLEARTYSWDMLITLADTTAITALYGSFKLSESISVP